MNLAIEGSFQVALLSTKALIVMKDDKAENHFAEQMIFDANLKEFASKVGIIVGLETGEKISSIEAYAQIKGLFKQLKASKKNLRIGEEGASDAENS